MKYKYGDLVKIVDLGKSYTTYNEWFKKTKNEDLEDEYDYGSTPSIRMEYIIVGYGNHCQRTKFFLYAIQNEYGDIYLIEEKGLRKINLRT